MSSSSNIEKRPGKLALEGIRVLDFTIGGAGPFATKLLADNGAEVIKVETSTHYDFPRTMGPYAGGVKGVNRSAYFTNRNSGKRSIAINLKKKEAAEALKRIIPTVDIVANNFRAGVLEKLGFGYQQLAAMRPDLIYISMPLQGSAGPQAEFSGVGHTLNVLAGIFGLTTYEDGTLVGPGTNFPDHSVNPGHAVSAIMAALIHRERTGLGQYLEVSQLESTMNLLGPDILGYSLSRQNPKPLGNGSAVHAPYGVYPAANNEWLALAVESDDEWQRLASYASDQSWAKDAKLATREGRLADVATLNAAMEAWTRDQDARELAAALQQNGVRAGLVQNARDLVDLDPQIAAREAFVTVDHPEMGPVVYNAAPYKLSATPPQIRSAPMLGQHNDEVFREWLGLPDEEMERLEKLEAFV
ncbi:formyl-CoA transferase [Nitratireductor aestuarii]|uniref:Formyl-CoA transferase n=1 Tax=Nitratireductor aestuarii TaxID=1735103 RepID=A0A916W579_9HYPH|nr:CoA transferase [Nitratireductor aestuarii]GGA66513.1 formyl-CoA transferase [Nitratireductor aestuarii]